MATRSAVHRRRPATRVAEVRWADYVVSTPTVLRGKPRIKGTRIPVSLILGYLAEGRSVQQVLKEFPELASEHVRACLDYARELASFEAAVA